MTIRLGLIGDNIATSRAPKLHRLCGRMCGVEVSYDLLIPKTEGLGFDELFQRCEAQGYNGINITLPYKIRVMPKLEFPDEMILQVGSSNTVVFGAAKPRGYNTDYTGFMAAYRNRFGATLPGSVAIAGAGGAGRAVAFALAKLGASEIRLYDGRREMCEALAASLTQTFPELAVHVCDSIGEAVAGSDGVANCTPLGMHGYPGTAIEASLLPGRRWAFDAVYTPMETEFLSSAKSAGLEILGGYELHFYQGILAFQHFTGLMPGDLQELRRSHLDDKVNG